MARMRESLRRILDALPYVTIDMGGKRSAAPKRVTSEISWNPSDNSPSTLDRIVEGGKAGGVNFEGRFREIVGDPINLLIARHPLAGFRVDGHVILHNGNRVPASGPLAYYGAFSSILVINRGVHEPLEEYGFQEVLEHLPDCPVMLELGAYWSHYSMWLKKSRPGSTVIMVEPEASNLEIGRNNFKINGMTGSFIQDFVGEGHFAVDAFLEGQGLERLHILHSDIQGFEVEMLAGAAGSLANHRVDYVFVSTHSLDLHESVIATLQKYGYRIELSSDYVTQTTSHDGLVLASAPHCKPVLNGFHPMGRTEILKSCPAELLASLADSRQSESTRATRSITREN